MWGWLPYAGFGTPVCRSRRSRWGIADTEKDRQLDPLLPVRLAAGVKLAGSTRQRLEAAEDDQPFHIPIGRAIAQGERHAAEAVLWLPHRLRDRLSRTNTYQSRAATPYRGHRGTGHERRCD